jgi:hypothetical protein
MMSDLRSMVDEILQEAGIAPEQARSALDDANEHAACCLGGAWVMIAGVRKLYADGRADYAQSLIAMGWTEVDRMLGAVATGAMKIEEAMDQTELIAIMVLRVYFKYRGNWDRMLADIEKQHQQLRPAAHVDWLRNNQCAVEEWLAAIDALPAEESL